MQRESHILRYRKEGFNDAGFFQRKIAMEQRGT